jgi:ATP-dependent helicase HrpB
LKEVNIIVTQPRRLAAKTLAIRVASVLKEEEGKTVGYKISREKKVSSSTKITYVTTGFLLQVISKKY